MSTITKQVESSIESDTATVKFTDGSELQAEQVIIKTNGWLKVSLFADGERHHHAPHTVQSVHGDSGEGGPVVYEKPHRGV